MKYFIRVIFFAVIGLLLFKVGEWVQVNNPENLVYYYYSTVFGTVMAYLLDLIED